jgi:hypothetical protein
MISVLSSYIFTPHTYVLFNSGGGADLVSMASSFPPSIRLQHKEAPLDAGRVPHGIIENFTVLIIPLHFAASTACRLGLSEEWRRVTMFGS